MYNEFLWDAYQDGSYNPRKFYGMLDFFKDLPLVNEFGEVIGSANLWSSFFDLLKPLAALMTTILILGLAVSLVIIMTTRSEQTIMAAKQYMKTAFQAWLILSFMNYWFAFCFSMCLAMEGAHW